MKLGSLFIVTLLASSFNARGEDLESVFTETQNTQTTRNVSMLADVLRGILRTPNAEQNYFLRLVSESNWTDALLQYKSAFQNSTFGNSEDGKALKALLMFKSGLPVNGLETLWTIRDPKKIHFQILSLWREAAPATHSAWQVAKLPWKAEWTELFGISTEVRVKAAELAFSSDAKALNALAAVATPDSRERALLDWNIAVQFGLKDDNKKAAQTVSALLKAKNNPIPEDLLTLTAARLLYQSGYFEAAEKYYDKISKGSDYFLEAQEEKAWSFLRRRQPQDALAVTQTLVNPAFSGQVGPETWFVRALSQLKVCDYPEALETLRRFPKEFKEQSVALENLSKNANTKEVASALQLIRENNLTLATMVKISKNLPRTMVRDQRLRQFVKALDQLEAEGQSAEKVFALSLKGTGLQGEFESIKNSIGQRAQQAKANSYTRVQEIAKAELLETKNILNKLHIVEAEIIQQVESAQRLSKNLQGEPETKKGTTGSKGTDVLQFPFDKEFWFDELTNYKVDIKKACQARRTQ